MNISACDICGNYFPGEEDIFCNNHHKYHAGCISFLSNYPRYRRNCQGCWEYIAPYIGINGTCTNCHIPFQQCQFSTPLCEKCTVDKFNSYNEICGACQRIHIKNLTESGYNNLLPRPNEIEPLLHESMCNLCEAQSMFSKSKCSTLKEYCGNCLNSDVMSKVSCMCEYCYELKEKCMATYFRKCRICNENIPISKLTNKCPYSYCENCKINPNFKEFIESSCKCEECTILGIKLSHMELIPKCIKCNEAASDFALIGCNHNLCKMCVYFRNVHKIEACIKNILTKSINKLENCMKYECCVDNCITRLNIPINFFRGLKENETIKSNPNIVNIFMMYLDGIPCKFSICQCNQVVGVLTGGLRLNCSCSGYKVS